MELCVRVWYNGVVEENGIYQIQYLSQPMVEFDNSTYSLCTKTDKNCKV